MARRNIGDNLFFRSSGGSWISLNNMYFMEAILYEWKLVTSEQPQLLCQGTPLPYYRSGEQLQGQWVAPFFAGNIVFSCDSEKVKTFVYPDSRKLTLQQYQQMMADILQEVALCFDYSGYTISIDTQAIQRSISWGQWSYIQNTFDDLIKIFRKIAERPQRTLVNKTTWVRREKVRELRNTTLSWMEKNIGKDTNHPIPPILLDETRTIHWETYENRVLKQQAGELGHLLEQYIQDGSAEIVTLAQKYKDQLQYWIGHSFMKTIRAWEGRKIITMTFRKHPLYSRWHQWFEKLYQHGQERLGFEYAFPLKETYALYEIWCYMKLVQFFRERNLLENTSSLFACQPDGLFLNLAKNRESCIRIKGGAKLYFQRKYQYNSPQFYSYTQQMIPDIVLEHQQKLYIFDPKYRVPSNVGMALGEMHKYRDGILSRELNQRVVEQVFILIPVKGKENEDLRYFQAEYHRKYGMGAICAAPGLSHEDLWRCLEGIVG